jgi:hypothetical protein
MCWDIRFLQIERMSANMKITAKELINMAGNLDVNEFISSIVLDGETESFIEHLGYKKYSLKDVKTYTNLIKADGDMEDVLRTIGFSIVDCTDVSLTISDHVDTVIIRGHAYPSRFNYEETELVLDFNDIVLEDEVEWKPCKHCGFNIPFKKNLNSQGCPNCTKVKENI